MLKMLRRLIGESIVLSAAGLPLVAGPSGPCPDRSDLANLCVTPGCHRGRGQITIETGNVTLDATDGAPTPGLSPASMSGSP